jgi:hypothetical protein
MIILYRAETVDERVDPQICQIDTDFLDQIGINLWKSVDANFVIYFRVFRVFRGLSLIERTQRV